MSTLRRISAASVAVLLLAGLALAPPGGAQEPPGEHTYLVRFEPGTDPDAASADLAASGAEVLHVYRNVFPGAAIRVPALRASSLGDNEDIARVQRDVSIHGTATQDDPPWGLDRIDQRELPLSRTYSYPATGAGVTAYVVDSGLNFGHTEFTGRVRSGPDHIDDDLVADDCHGHGTHVAGTLAGTLFGVAKQASIVPVRVLDCVSSGSASGLLAGLDWVAADHTAGSPAVVNLSVGLDSPVFEVELAIETLIAQGVIVVIAAGNDDVDACGVSPGRVPGAITVGATDRNDVRADFSNHGSCVDLFAPGVEIPSAFIGAPTAIMEMQGTSMAAPHVAGTAAILLAQQPGVSPAEVTAQLTGNATPDLVGDPAGSPNLLLFNPASPRMTLTGSPVAPGGSVQVSGVECGNEHARVMVGLMDADRAGIVAMAAPAPGPDGAWSARLVVPADTRPGTYPLVASCTTYDGYDGYNGYNGGVFQYDELSVEVLPPNSPPDSADGPLSVNPEQVAAGASVSIRGEGFDAGEQVTVALYSSPTVLARLTSDAGGVIAAKVIVPAGTALGKHTVVAMNAQSALHPARTLQGDLTVVAPPDDPDPDPPIAGTPETPTEVKRNTSSDNQRGAGLAFTGGNAMKLVVLALLLLGSGAVLRRNRRGGPASTG